MGKVFITGSSDGIGLKTGQILLSMGHEVVFHARNAARAEETKALTGRDISIVTGDLSSLDDTRELALEAEKFGPYDAIIHNAGIGGGADDRTVTKDGFERIFQINVLAPYLLTSLMSRAEKMIYLSSGLEANGIANLDDVMYETRNFHSMQVYSDSKLYDVMIAFAVSRLWSGVLSNAVDPGWIKTKLGGANATDNLDRGAETQVWLTEGTDPASLVTGKYFKWKQELTANPAAYDISLQDRLLELCAELTGVKFPA